MIEAYEGEKPYIFISYAHKDSDVVMPIIEALIENDYRVWYDAGIQAGSEWPEYIASHLKGCSCVLSFISENYVHSHNCRRELNFAQDLQKELLNIYIEDVELSDGMKMQLGLNQALFKKKFKTEKNFLQALLRAQMIQGCKKVTIPQNKETTKPKPQEQNNEVTVQKTEVVPEQIEEVEEVNGAKSLTVNNSTRKKIVAWTDALLQLSYAVLGPLSIHLATQNYINVGLLILFTALPLVILTIICLIIYKTVGSTLTGADAENAYMPAFMCWMLAMLIALIASPFFVHTTENIFLKIIIPIGLNVIATVAAGIVLFIPMVIDS